MTKTFSVTPEKLEALSSYMKDHGLVLDPSAAQGKAVQGSWEVGWTVQGNQLTVTVDKHPIGEENIFWGRLEKLLS